MIKRRTTKKGEIRYDVRLRDPSGRVSVATSKSPVMAI
jgi:hypothetical protein